MPLSQRKVDTHCGDGADWIMPLKCNSVGTSKGVDSINAPFLFFSDFSSSCILLNILDSSFGSHVLRQVWRGAAEV